MQVTRDIGSTKQSLGSSQKQDPRGPAFVETFIRFLSANGHISAPEGARAVEAQRQTGERIDVVLTELGIVPATDMLAILSEFCEIPLAAAGELPQERMLEDVLSIDFMRRSQVVPIGETDESLFVAIADPFARETLAAIAFIVDRPVYAKLASRADIEEAIGRIDDRAEEQLTAEPVVSGQAGSNPEDIQRLKDIASEAPVIRYVTRLIGQAVTEGASDLHIEPTANGSRVRFRVDGVMSEIERVPRELQAGVISRIKILAQLNIAERRLPQDGRAKFVVGGRQIDLRVSTMPTLHGESTVLRILDPSRIVLSFPELGFETAEIEAITRLLSQPNGIVLITGPTGSGKTTTLYTALKAISSVEKKILTVEDPIEYELANLNQIQIHPQIGLDFAPALRSILRQDPDVIMIGEMRDLETARIGIQAALTGHLVLSTLHTNSAPASIVRLLDIGAEDYLVASSLIAVAAQRLVRTLCEDCSVPSPTTMKRLARLNIDSIAFEGTLPLAGAREPVGCPKCKGTGFRGRTTIFELLEIDDHIRAHIRRGTTERELREIAIERGMSTLLKSGVRKILHGKTTLDEVLKAASG